MPFSEPIQCVNGVDISDWPETAHITSIEFAPNDFVVHHSKEDGDGRWPDVHVPGWGDIERGGSDPGNIQWTLWVVVNVNGRYFTTGCLEFWHGHNNVRGPFSNAAKDWYYQAGEMAGHQPQPGDRVGFLVTSGDHRMKDITIVRERSAVAWLTVPANDAGGFLFGPPKPTAVPDPPPPPPAPIPLPDPPKPVPAPAPSNAVLSAILTALIALRTQLAEINKKLDASATKTDVQDLRQQAIDAIKALPLGNVPGGVGTVDSILKMFGGKK